jgi:hypothetical protein
LPLVALAEQAAQATEPQAATHLLALLLRRMAGLVGLRLVVLLLAVHHFLLAQLGLLLLGRGCIFRPRALARLRFMAGFRLGVVLTVMRFMAALVELLPVRPPAHWEAYHFMVGLVVMVDVLQVALTAFNPAAAAVAETTL